MYLPILDPNNVFEASQGMLQGLVAGTPGFRSLSSAIVCDQGRCSLTLCNKHACPSTNPWSPERGWHSSVEDRTVT